MGFPRVEAHPLAVPALVTREYGTFFLGPDPAIVPKPINTANRCNLRHVTPKTLQKALYVVFFGSSRLLQVVCLGWSQFPVPQARLALARPRACTVRTVNTITPLRLGRIPRQPLDGSNAASTLDDLADSSGYLWSWNALHLAGFNVGNAPAGLGFPASFDSGAQMQPLGQPVHQLHHLLMGQVTGLFNNLINRHRHSANLPITNQPLKAKARPLNAVPRRLASASC
jgi:hypothetical protein